MALSAEQQRALELEGYAACLVARGLLDCPYDEGTEERTYWDQGWDQAWTDVTESSSD